MEIIEVDSLDDLADMLQALSDYMSGKYDDNGSEAYKDKYRRLYADGERVEHENV